MIYFTSDTHFNHKNIVEFCNRPFRTLDGHADLQAMNRAIIQAWNSRVQPGDVVYHLGDFGMGSWKEWKALREKLNGSIILISGNHDRKLAEWLKPSDVATTNITLSAMGRPDIYLAHAPPSNDDIARYKEVVVLPIPPEARIMLCGHVHDKWAYKEVRLADGRMLKCYNVGVDVRGYVPQTLDEILGNPYGKTNKDAVLQPVQTT